MPEHERSILNLRDLINEARSIFNNPDLLWRTKFDAIFGLKICTNAQMAGFPFPAYDPLHESLEADVTAYMASVEELSKIVDAEIPPTKHVIRLCPTEDGKVFCHLYDDATEEYMTIAAPIAMQYLAMNTTAVEVAVPDPHDKNSHYESGPASMRRI